MVDFRIHFLGTASAVPTKERSLSCVAINYENTLAIFDCGEGSQKTIMEAGLGLNKDCSVFITHMHGDHIIGLLGLLQTMSMNRRDKQLRVFGPKGVFEFIMLNQKILNFGLTFEVVVKVVKKGLVFGDKNSKFRVFAERSEHSTHSFSYILEEREKPGKFNPAKALALGIPEGPLWSILQHGKSVVSPKTKKKVSPDQVMGKPRKGKRIGISGETRPSKTFQKFFKGSDVLIFDSTYSDKHAQNAVENMHSTSREAATVAKKARVKKLFLTHFSARYTNVSPLVKQAREVFPNSVAARDSMVYDVSDLS